MKKVSWKELATKDLKGKVFILPTDTIYGFSALAFNDEAIDRIYQIKRRDKNKKMINLISSLDDLKKFNVQLSRRQENFLKTIWPGPVSVILKNEAEEKLSFRLPGKRKLRKFIKEVGPIVSTSLNISGEENIKSLKSIDFPGVDFFIDEGELNNESSLIIEFLR